jgi:hypothetical protein
MASPVEPCIAPSRQLHHAVTLRILLEREQNVEQEFFQILCGVIRIWQLCVDKSIAEDEFFVEIHCSEFCDVNKGYTTISWLQALLNKFEMDPSFYQDVYRWLERMY